MESIYAISKRQWEELLTPAPPPSLVPRLLLLDHQAAQVLKSSIGIDCLLNDFGFSHLLSLDDQVNSSMQACSCLPLAPRISVFIATTSLLTESHACIIQAISSLSSAAREASIAIDQITVLSSHSEYAHACLEHSSNILGVEAYSDYSELLLEDLLKAMMTTTTPPSPSSSPSQPPRIVIKHFPLLTCPILPWAFVLPQAQSTSHSPTASAIRTSTGGGGGGGGGEGGGGREEEVSRLAHSLGSWAVQIGATSLETYHLSPPHHPSLPSGSKAGLISARAVAEELSSLPLPFPSSSPLTPSPLTLILVDRGYDLASPCSKGGALLPFSSSLASTSTSTATEVSQPLPHPMDLAVASSPLLFPSSSSSSSSSSFPLPSLFNQHPLEPSDLDSKSASSHTSWVQRIEQILSRRPRDVLPLLRKWLKEALRQEGLSPSQRSKAGSVTPEEIQGLISDLMALIPIPSIQQPSGKENDTPPHDQPPADNEPKGGPGGRSRGHGVAALLRHSSLLSLSLKLSEASSPPSSLAPPPMVQRWIAASSLERQILALLVQSGDVMGLHSLLLDAFDQAKGSKGPLLVTDIIQLLPIIYSLWPDASPPYSGDDSEDKRPGEEGGPFSAQQETELVRSAAQSIVAHLATLLSAPKDPHGNLMNKGQGASSKADEHLSFIPCETLASLLEMGRAGKEGKLAASKDIQRFLRAFLTRLKASASLRNRLVDDELRCLTYHSSRPRDMFSDPPPLTLDPLLVTLLIKVTKGQSIPDLHLHSGEDEGKVGTRGVDLRGGVSGALMAGTGLIAKGIAGTLGAILSSSSASASVQEQQRQGGDASTGGESHRRVWIRGETSRVVVFVIGGISVQEIRRVSIEMIALQQQQQQSQVEGQGGGGVERVWIGGTGLISSPLAICSSLIAG